MTDPYREPIVIPSLRRTWRELLTMLGNVFLILIPIAAAGFGVWCAHHKRDAHTHVPVTPVSDEAPSAGTKYLGFYNGMWRPMPSPTSERSHQLYDTCPPGGDTEFTSQVTLRSDGGIDGNWRCLKRGAP
jgi:hypothetical protein